MGRMSGEPGEVQKRWLIYVMMITSMIIVYSFSPFTSFSVSSTTKVEKVASQRELDYLEENRNVTDENLNDDSSKYSNKSSIIEYFNKKKFQVSFDNENNADFLNGYDNCTEFISDIEKSLERLANSLIYRDIVDNNLGPPVMLETTSTEANTDTEVQDEKTKEDSYETNNQHQGIDEADIVKSDGEFVYVAYGTEIVTLDLNGNEVSRIKSFEENPIEQFRYGFDANATDDETEPLRRTAVYIRPNKKIHGLLLVDGKYLVSIQSGYDDSEYGHMSLVSDFFYFSPDTKIEIAVYDLFSSPEENESKNGTLTLLKRESLKGTYFRKGVTIQESNKIALVTSSSVKLNQDFHRHLSRYYYFGEEITDEEYIDRAFEKAQKIIPKVAKRLQTDFVSASDKTMIDMEMCSRSTKILNYYESDADDESEDKTEKAKEEVPMELNLDGYVEITTIDFSSSDSKSSRSRRTQRNDDNEIDYNKYVIGSLIPSSEFDVYFSPDSKLFLGNRGVRYMKIDKDKNDEMSIYFGGYNYVWKQYTYITAYDLLSEEHPKAIATGVVPGYTLNQYSYDFYDGYLRIATSLSQNRYWNESSSSWVVHNNATNQIVVTSMEENKIVVASMLEELGIQDNERIYSCRFYKDFSYIVTFRQTDPFYWIDLRNPLAPRLFGELKIPGYSNYLHPIFSDDSDGNIDYILGVGQDVDPKTNAPLGFKISLFDVRLIEPENEERDFILIDPKPVGNYIVPQSYSDAQFDYHAFRYLPQSRKLIVPVQEYNRITPKKEEDFDGFQVFDIHLPPSNAGGVESEFDNEGEADVGIALDFTVPHYQVKEQNYCYSGRKAYLNPRSLVFQGVLMTLKGHSIQLHDLISNKDGETIMNSYNLDRFRGKDHKDSDKKFECYEWFGYDLQEVELADDDETTTVKKEEERLPTTHYSKHHKKKVHKKYAKHESQKKHTSDADYTYSTDNNKTNGHFTSKVTPKVGKQSKQHNKRSKASSHTLTKQHKRLRHHTYSTTEDQDSEFEFSF